MVGVACPRDWSPGVPGGEVAAALPDITSRVISAWPPLAFAAAFELILRLVRSTDSSQAGDALVDPGDADLMARAIELVE